VGLPTFADFVGSGQSAPKAAISIEPT